jgi:hypothetical protein
MSTTIHTLRPSQRELVLELASERRANLQNSIQLAQATLGHGDPSIQNAVLKLDEVDMLIAAITRVTPRAAA